MFNHRLPPVASFARPAGAAAPSPAVRAGRRPGAAPAAEPPGARPGRDFQKEPAAPRRRPSRRRGPPGASCSRWSASSRRSRPTPTSAGAPPHCGGLFARADRRASGLGSEMGAAQASSRTWLPCTRRRPPPCPHPHPRRAARRTDDAAPRSPSGHPSIKKAKRAKPESQGIKAKKRKPGASSKPPPAKGTGRAPCCPRAKPRLDHCSAAFRSSYHLRRHVLIHGRRPFQCGQCSMGFIRSTAQRHERSTAARSPSLHDQSVKFIQKYHMERHKRTAGKAIQMRHLPAVLLQD